MARNPVYRATVKNNVGLVLLKLSRYKEAHRYLDEARRLAVSFKDKARTAQFDETRAQVFLAEKKFKEAEAVARKAVLTLEKIGHKCLEVDALITQGIALARWGKNQRAHFIFQKAIEVALQVDALNKAGLAALTLVEEVDQLSPATLQAAYQQAREWLADAQSQDMLLRLNDTAGKLATSLRGELSGDEATEILLSKGFDLQGKILEYERSMIKQALTQANGHSRRLAAPIELSRARLHHRGKAPGFAYSTDSRTPSRSKQA